MNQALFQGLMQHALLTVLLLSAPALLVAIVIGLGVGLLQALTQVQDQTLPQGVKLVAVLLVVIFLGPLLAGQVMGLADEVLNNFPAWTR
ncbi:MULTISPECIES: flagellar biosynthetic protein FliQ [Pseudomonas]|jgi:type III secretion protein S|uniref:Type III secretion protein S n=1 Tax=Ectopseudomonas oleovorans TaxID=301 RepID=A0A3D9EBK0_ECTOL|nr:MULTISPECIES: flagellar biosynthetic protein FliQ [Pseudomonas]MDR6231145.1 type III secretion protein S [Pseudomonas sp. SORGH_AS_0199]RED00356.1 type III secretion protein S [Pseudomonas oleovorans]